MYLQFLCKAIKMLCENKAKCLYSTSTVARARRDVERNGHVVMHGGGPILRGLAVGE